MPRSNAHPPRWLTQAEQRAWWALLEVGAGLFDVVTADLKESCGLTLEDYEVLHLLSIADERSLRVGALADQMLTSRTRLTQRLDRLAERGLLSKQRCPEDGRAVNVVLSDIGWKLLVEIAPGHVESVRTNVFEHLTDDDVEAIGTSLDKLAQHLHRTRNP
ncbi:MAG: MarR family winged helix-turn-helix transcriptional regulator [Acidimicrobiales bacterium]